VADEFDCFERPTEAVKALAAADGAGDGAGEGGAEGDGEAKGTEGGDGAGEEAPAEGEEGAKVEEEPSVEPPSFDLSAPQHDFTLEWVYGYQSQAVRNSLRYVNNGTGIAYSSAAVGVVYDPVDHRQWFNRNAGSNAGATDDIISLAASQCGRYVAVGERGRRPNIIVFDAASGRTLSIISGHANGVAQLAFSHSGSKLLSVGADPSHRVCMYVRRCFIVWCVWKPWV